MIQTLTFGYLPKKWKRLIRTIFFLGYTFHLWLIYWEFFRSGFSDASVLWYVVLILLIAPFLILFLLSWLIQPFVIKDED